MSVPAPQIGFDRFIQHDWVAAVVAVRQGAMPLATLHDMLQASGLGKEALSKTLTKLNGLGLAPRDDLADFVERGCAIVGRDEDPDRLAAYAWGVAIATYSFFGRVAEFVGRLTMLQGDCSSAEIHRRMSEVYGDRQVTKRATQAVLQTQSSWGSVQRVEGGRRVVRLPPKDVDDDTLTEWLIEAALRYMGKAVPVQSIQSLPVLFPFNFTRPLTYVVSRAPQLVLRSEGPSSQYAALRESV
ncbi:hypothetical protein ACUH78_17145 [Thauera sp. ZXT1-4]|uniref:hypothetical protein n=1 Tax=Thauera sp. ZXT1-4 TaxID=3460294 RepID=UPI0040408AA8